VRIIEPEAFLDVPAEAAAPPDFLALGEESGAGCATDRDSKRGIGTCPSAEPGVLDSEILGSLTIG